MRLPTPQFSVTLLFAAVMAFSAIAQSQPLPFPSPPTAVSTALFLPAPVPDRPKIAVYVFGADDPALNKAMAARLIVELVNTGRYQAAENYKEFFNRVDEEPKGAAGLVSSARMAELGKLFDLAYVCVAEVITVSGERQASAHILGVGGGGVAAMGGGGVTLGSLADVIVAAGQIVKAMFMGAPAPMYAPMPVSVAEDMFAGAGVWPVASEFTDVRDGKVYETVRIGGVAWMARNLNYRAPAGSWCYLNDNFNCDAYGRLYDWNTAGAACPPGWHLPSRQEWNNLVAAAGGSAAAGKRLKSITGWSISSSGFDDYGFSALPGGSRDSVGAFSGVGGNGSWWTGTPGLNGSAYYRYTQHDLDDSGERAGGAGYGFSVRCVQK